MWDHFLSLDIFDFFSKISTFSKVRPQTFLNLRNSVLRVYTGEKNMAKNPLKRVRLITISTCWLISTETS